MKKYIILMLVFLMSLLMLTADTYAEIKVPERVRIGMKYGSSAITSAELLSTDGFSFYALGDEMYKIAGYEGKAVTLHAIDSFYVVHKEFDGDYEGAKSYCSESGASLFYKNSKYYAVSENLYTQEAADAELARVRETNPSAYPVGANQSRITFRDKSGKTILIFAGEDGMNPAVGSAGDLYITYEGTSYRGLFEYVRKGASVDVIANITMQQYLYGVVPSEIGPSAPLEAQKAQAICARTYAVKNLNRHSKDGFNLCATTCCQVYFGMKKESKLSSTAVDETAGKIITYKGEPITAVYSAHSGGKTAFVEDVWGSPYDYLKGVDDPYCNDYTWEADLDYEVLTASFEKKGYDIGEVTDVSVTKTNAEGRVLELTVTGTKGKKTFLRESARTVLGLKSQIYTIGGGDLMYQVLSASGQSRTDILKAGVLTANGKKSITGSTAVKDGNGEIKILNSAGGNKIYGKGYGHGVGLSQCGAMGFAENGWNYEQILKHYYTGVEIN